MNYTLLRYKLHIVLLYAHIVYELLTYDLDQIYAGIHHIGEACFDRVSPGYVLEVDCNLQMSFHNVDTVYEHISLEVQLFEVPEIQRKNILM